MRNHPKQVPFLMSTAMVQAILAGRKTQTRRIATNIPDDSIKVWPCPGEGWACLNDEHEALFSSKVKPKATKGDIIWVRENYQQAGWAGDTLVSPAYMADGHTACGWKPSIHMPKSAARIWLRCTGVKAERAQDISEDDAIAEGIETLAVDSGADDYATYYRDYGQPFPNGNDGWPWFNETEAVQSFRSLWQSIHSDPPKPGKPDGRWEANPWVWAYSFEVLSTTGKPDNI